MPAGQFTPGPQHLFARFRSNPVAQYLGTCVRAPDPEHEFYYLDVENDIGGRSVPYQLIQDGENARIVLVMNRFDINICRGIRALHAAAGGGTVNQLGSETAYARGTLVIGSSDFELVCVNSYAGTPSAGLPLAAAAFLNAGRRYVSVVPTKYKESTEGTRVLEVAMALRCENGAVGQAFQLYTETDLGALGPIT
jgi:hypothetical protein